MTKTDRGVKATDAGYPGADNGGKIISAEKTVYPA